MSEVLHCWTVAVPSSPLLAVPVGHPSSASRGPPMTAARSRLWPLRRIVGTAFGEHNLVVEVLECGHRVRPKEDMFGTTNAERRRCSECAKTEQPGDHQ